MKLEELIKRTEELLSLGQKVLQSTHMYSSSGSEYVDSGLFRQFRVASLSFFKNTFSIEHPYFKEFDKFIRSADPSDTKTGIGILKAVIDEFKGGWVFTVKGLVSAEIFSDFLEMSNYLLSEGYKDPAAVLIGSVLEEHLRQLCNKNGIPVEIVKDSKPVPKKADSLNSELAASNIYNKLDQKQVTAWFDLRNKAAHGKYSEYSKDQVQIMYHGVVNFMSRTT